MSSSPTLCDSPSYVFPPPLSSGSKSITGEFDYFSISSMKQPVIPSATPTSIVKNLPSLQTINISANPVPLLQKSHHHNSCGMNNSISSTSSEQTLFSAHPRKYTKRTDSSISTETLIDDVLSNKNFKNYMNLSLTVPKDLYQPSSFSAVDNPQSCSDDESKAHSNAGNPKDNVEQRRLNSATESKFPDMLSYTNSSANIASKTASFPGTISFNMNQLSLQNHEISFNAIQKSQFNSYNKLNNKSPRFLKRDLSSALPAEVVPYNGQELCNQLSNKSSLILVIDIRPFNDFVKSHIRGAINVCLPSTLLKRPNYSLTKCINSLTDFERQEIINFCSSSADNLKLILYDNYSSGYLNTNSQTISHMCQKFLNDYNHYDVCVLQGGYQEFYKNHSEYTESGIVTLSSPVNNNSNNDASHTNNSVMPNSSPYTPNTSFGDKCSAGATAKYSSTNTKCSCIPPVSASSPVTPSHSKILGVSKTGFFSPPKILSSTSPNSNSSFSNGSPRMVNTPVLSRFILPEYKSLFKIRHNEESLITNVEDDTSSEFQLVNNYKNFSKLEQDILPKWIKKSSPEICKEFSNLELIEQSRLSGALKLKDNSNQTHNQIHNNVQVNEDLLGLASPPPKISSGIEYGYKNRYKDIFLYEHSRVKLCDCGNNQDRIPRQQETSPLLCDDYINASYLKQNNDIKYIATQGPLKETIGDFWKCVVNDKVPIIISLTSEKENGISKCSPFWDSGVYKSSSNLIRVEELENETVLSTNQNMIIRRFVITIDNQIKHNVMQIQVLSWPDMDLIMNPKELLSIVFLKQFVLDQIGLKSPVLVHCSAGCGRTGSLCAIDTVIDIISSSASNIHDNMNLIYDTVNSFRKQRVSMVQTVRQYLLIYDLILMYLMNKIYLEANPVSNKYRWESFNDLTIVKNFVNQHK